MNLYDLNQNYNNILELMDNEDIEKSVLENALSSIQEDINVKVDNIVKFIRNLEGNISALKEEEKKLADKRKSIEKQKANLEQYLFGFTSLTEAKKIQGKVFTVQIKKNPPSVFVDDLEAIPSEFKIVKTVVEADKTLIKAALKNGEIIQGCRLEVKEGLKIK